MQNQIKLRATWNPDVDQDIHAMTLKGSPFFDQELYDRVNSYPSIEEFRQSEWYKELRKNYYGKSDPLYNI